MGHEAIDVRDIGMRGASDDAIAAHVRRTRQVLITRDFDFSDIRNYPPGDYAGIVVLKLTDDATAARLVDVLEMFARREDWLARLPGRLAIVEGWRVRFRPA
jgi:predicted nuclease of predicted toxin-antitoxin system